MEKWGVGWEIKRDWKTGGRERERERERERDVFFDVIDGMTERETD